MSFLHTGKPLPSAPTCGTGEPELGSLVLELALGRLGTPEVCWPRPVAAQRLLPGVGGVPP